ncbi:hypothetical protein Tco_0148833 [Tanacetum coccineum]
MLILLVMPDIVQHTQKEVNTAKVSSYYYFNAANRRSFLLLVTTAWFKGKVCVLIISQMAYNIWSQVNTAVTTVDIN